MTQERKYVIHQESQQTKTQPKSKTYTTTVYGLCLKVKYYYTIPKWIHDNKGVTLQRSTLTTYQVYIDYSKSPSLSASSDKLRTS